MRTGARRQRGQVTVELAVLYAAIIGAVIFMAIYLQRGAQGGIKSNADQLGSQFSVTSPWNQTTITNTTTNETSTEVRTNQTQNLDYSQTMSVL